MVASKELKAHILSNEWNHNFDSNQSNLPPVGKMFGVLVVQSANGDLGYLSAFSGKLGEEVLIEPFVPPIFDRLTEDSYFLEGKDELNAINNRVDALEADPNYAAWKELLKKDSLYAEMVISDEKAFIKKNKAKRRNEKLQGIAEEDLKKLNHQSLQEQLRLKRLKRFWRSRLEYIQSEIDICLLYTSPSPRDRQKSRMPSSA